MNPEHERRMRDVLAAEHPDCAVSLSSDVLSEYREYERVRDHARRRVRQAARRRVRPLDRGSPRPAVLHHEEQRRRDRGQRGGRASRSRRSCPVPPRARWARRWWPRQAGFRRVITLDGGGTSTDVAVISDGRPSLTTEGSVGRFAVKVPMVDVVDGRHRRRVDRLGVARGDAEGGPALGRARARARPATRAAAASRRRPTRSCSSATSRSTCSAARSRSSRAASEAVYERLAGRVGLGVEACAAGVLEIAAWNQANAIRQVTVKRGLDVRDFDLCAFGGSGPLTACRLIDILGLRDRVRAARPRQPQRVRAAGHRPADRPRADAGAPARPARRSASSARAFARLEADAVAALERQGHATDRCERSADLRYFGQAFEIHVPAPDGPVDAAFVQDVEARFHDAHERSYGYCYRDDPEPGRRVGEPARHRRRRDGAAGAEARSRPTGDPLTGQRRVFFGDRRHETPIYARERLRRRRSRARR